MRALIAGARVEPEAQWIERVGARPGERVAQQAARKSPPREESPQVAKALWPRASSKAPPQPELKPTSPRTDPAPAERILRFRTALSQPKANPPPWPPGSGVEPPGPVRGHETPHGESNSHRRAVLGPASTPPWVRPGAEWALLQPAEGQHGTRPEATTALAFPPPTNRATRHRYRPRSKQPEHPEARPQTRRTVCVGNPRPVHPRPNSASLIFSAHLLQGA